MGKTLMENEPKDCIFLERGSVDPERGYRIRHEYCKHPEMRTINKVPLDQEISCMGLRCGCAVFQQKEAPNE